MLSIFVRTVLVYFFLALLMQLTGKRQIGQLQVSELICALLLSELAAGPIADSATPLSQALIPILTLTALEIVVSFLVTKSEPLRKLFDGEPNILIRRGKLDQKALAAARISLDELLGHMRLAGITTLSDVDYAILEQNGQLSFLPTAAARAATTADLKLKPTEDGIAHPLVLDGKLQVRGLSLTKKTETWVLERLATRGLALDDVFLFTLDDSGRELCLRAEKENA